MIPWEATWWAPFKLLAVAVVAQVYKVVSRDV